MAQAGRGDRHSFSLNCLPCWQQHTEPLGWTYSVEYAQGRQQQLHTAGPGLALQDKPEAVLTAAAPTAVPCYCGAVQCAKPALAGPIQTQSTAYAVCKGRTPLVMPLTSALSAPSQRLQGSQEPPATGTVVSLATGHT